MSCGVGHRHGTDPTLLWLWRRPAAVAPIRLLAWELPYAAGVALKRQKNKQKKISVYLYHCFLKNTNFDDDLPGYKLKCFGAPSWPSRWGSVIVTAVGWVRSLAQEVLHATSTASPPPKKKKKKMFFIKYFTMYRSALASPRWNRWGQNDTTKETDMCTLSSHVGKEHTSADLYLDCMWPWLTATAWLHWLQSPCSCLPTYQSLVCTSCTLFSSPPVSISPQSW